MDQLHINEVVKQIDTLFGEDLPFTGESLSLSSGDIEALTRIFGDEGYQGYQDDQTNRQIIRVYLTNAVILGLLPEEQIAA